MNAVCALALALALQVPPFSGIVLPASLRDSMALRWAENNRHWNELSDVNTLTQLIGGQPTQREYLGCLQGKVTPDTLRITALVSAKDLKQLQFAAAGSCDDVPDLVGTWHTHPYRADANGRAQKERVLSSLDLETFAAAPDLVTLIMWDVDSLDAAAKAADGTVRHPFPLLVR